MNPASIVLYSPKDPIAFSLFNFPIRWYGLIMACAFFIGIFFAYRTIKKKYNPDLASSFLDYSPMIIIYSVLGARIFYILGDLKFYIENPLETIMLNHGGLSIWGAIAFGIVALYIYSRRLKFDFLQNLDIFALFMPICQAIGRLGNFYNQEAYGLPTDGFIKLYIDKYHRYRGFKSYDYYHPAFLYEMILDIILFLILFFLFTRSKSPKKGVITCLYLILYGIIRILIEQIRVDSIMYIHDVPIAVVISVLAIVFGSLGLVLINKK